MGLSANVGTGDKTCPCLQDCKCNDSLKTEACCCNEKEGPKCGCTDPKAGNYDPKAEVDDCSCDIKCHHTTGHKECSGSASFDIKKIKTKKAGLEGYANLIGPEMLIIDELLDI